MVAISENPLSPIFEKVGKKTLLVRAKKKYFLQKLGTKSVCDCTLNQDRKLRSYSGMLFCESECHWEPKLPGNFGPIWEPP